jgi:murein L,D-transpeptidase YcbB/YkuD
MLKGNAVRRFYEARQFKPAWKGGDADQILNAIREVERDSLNPSDYHLAALQKLLGEREKSTNPALEADADILLTDAIAGLVDHVRYGRVRPVLLNPRWNLDPREGAPPPPKVVARIAATGELKGRGTSTVYDPGPRKSVELFQTRHRLDPNGIIDKDVIDAMNVSAAARADQVRVNLERSRWVLPGLGNEFLLVNLPAFKAYLIRGDRNVWEARTQIGEEGKQTPSFVAMMRTVVFNPDWTVPPMILRDEVIGGMKRGKNYIAQRGS